MPHGRLTCEAYESWQDLIVDVLCWVVDWAVCQLQQQLL